LSQRLLGKERGALNRSINQQVAAKLHEAGDVLEQQAANPFRVGAYRRAADTIAGLDEDLSALIAKAGADALIELPNIGKGIAAAIDEIVRTGRWVQLERLRGSLDPERLFKTVPGIGPKLAKRIHDQLDIETLEALENAAHDGRLEALPGVGARRGTAIRATLESMLGRIPRQSRREPAPGPSVELVLDVDSEYRNKASAGQLPTISPRRFNPNDEAWLPILHTERDLWHFTVLFSNTARAHDLGRSRDWVVVYFYDDHHREGQCTVVTETRGALTGKRVVRGREEECRALYAK
jgi:DNA uptake protein ComE-like DNA-binding protein